VIASLAARYLSELDMFMRQIVDSAPQEPEFAVMLRYPLGWVDAQGSPYNHPTGKRIRPLLLLLCAEATGGDWRQAIPAAAAVELLHNFSLIHDDIQDDSPTRHNRPTVWKIWGRSQAINAGDAMFSLAYVALQRLAQSTATSPVALKCWDIFNRTCLELTRGQHLDMRFESQQQVTVDEYLSMISGKSAALIGAAAELGALIGSGSENTAAHFASFGYNLGMAFQIHDDILGIWGDPSVTGKSAATDIISRKKSLPVLYGLSKSPELVQVYAKPNFSDADVAEAVRLLNSVNALDYTRQSEEVYYRKALDSLGQGSSGRAYDDLAELSEALFARTY